MTLFLLVNIYHSMINQKEDTAALQQKVKGLVYSFPVLKVVPIEDYIVAMRVTNMWLIFAIISLYNDII